MTASVAVQPAEKSTPQDRGSLATMTMKLLDHWGLSTEDQAALLGLAANNRSALSRYRRG
jgi:hypothetical protein